MLRMLRKYPAQTVTSVDKLAPSHVSETTQQACSLATSAKRLKQSEYFAVNKHICLCRLGMKNWDRGGRELLYFSAQIQACNLHEKMPFYAETEILLNYT